MRASTVFFVLALFLIVGCGQTLELPPTAMLVEPTLVPTPPTVDRSRLSPTLTLYRWFDYLDPQVLNDFETEYGVKVIDETYDSSDAMFAQVQANPGKYDVLLIGDYMIDHLRKEGMLQPLDSARLPGLANIGAFYRNTWFDPDGQYCVPYAWGTTGILYDSTVITQTVDSWALLFNPPPIIHGKFTMLGEKRELVGAALKYLGYSLNSQNATEIAAAKELLRQQRPVVADYTADNIREKVIAGELVAAQIWSGNHVNPATMPSHIKYVIPKEGANIYQDSFCIPADAPNLYTSETFLNYLLRPEVNARLATYAWVPTANDAARPFLDQALLGNPSLYPPAEVMLTLERLQPLPLVEHLYDDAGAVIDEQ